MKLILIKDVAGIGRAGDVKEVSDGHARNFLLPRNLALPATTQSLAKLQKEQQEHQAKVAKEGERALELKKKIESKTITLKAKASGTNLFAAVSAKQVHEKLAEAGIEVGTESIEIPKPLKSTGKHEVLVALAKNVAARLKLVIEGIEK